MNRFLLIFFSPPEANLSICGEDENRNAKENLCELTITFRMVIFQRLRIKLLYKRKNTIFSLVFQQSNGVIVTEDFLNPLKANFSLLSEEYKAEKNKKTCLHMVSVIGNIWRLQMV